VTWKNLRKSIEEGVTEYDTKCPQKNQADRVDPDCLRSHINAGQPHVTITKDVNGNVIKTTESKDVFEARIKLRNKMESDAQKLGISITGKELNPYIRSLKNAGEARAGFEASGVFANVTLRDGLLKIFTDKAIHDHIADAWLKKLIRQVGAQGLAPAKPTTTAEEKDLAEWVFSKHNGGEGQGVEKDKKDKIENYIAKVDPIWERTFCLATNDHAKQPGHIRLAPLQLEGAMK
jgi:hypothetical protein